MNKTEIIGIGFDGGISAMQHLKRGVTGAKNAPSAIFKVLPNHIKDKVEFNLLELEKYNSVVNKQNAYNHEFIAKQKKNVLGAHEVIEKAAYNAAKKGFFVSIGGDHSISKPLIAGVSKAYKEKGENIGVIYLDAHFDMRELEKSNGTDVISSGNPFWRLIEDGDIQGSKLVVLGIQKSSTESFKTLEKYAKSKGVTVIYHNILVEDIQNSVKKAVEIACEETAGFYLSIDTDVVHKDFAPGVSAPAENGISRNQLFEIIEQLKKTNNMLAADIVEISSRDLTWQNALTGKNPAKNLDNPDFIKTTKLGADMVTALVS